MKRFVILGVGLLVAVGFSACGGGSSAPSTADVVAKADPICKNIKQSANTISNEVSKATSGNPLEIPGNLKNAAPAIAQQVDSIKSDLKQLKDLEPSQEMKNAYDQFVASVKSAEDILGQVKAAIESGNLLELQSLASQQKQNLEKFKSTAHGLDKYGFKECGKVFSGT
jgi:hypothetical protein